MPFTAVRRTFRHDKVTAADRKLFTVCWPEGIIMEKEEEGQPISMFVTTPFNSRQLAGKGD